jgi:hypothetical protein
MGDLGVALSRLFSIQASEVNRSGEPAAGELQQVHHQEEDELLSAFSKSR